MKKIGRIITLLFVLVVVWVLWSLFSHGFSVPDAADYPHQLRVLTYNTHGLGLTGNKNAQELLAYVGSRDADIVCMQEVSVYKNSDHLSLPELRRAMRQYPYTYYDFKVYNSHRQFGNVVFSRYPLIHKYTLPYESRSNISSRCDVVVGTDTLRLIVNHLESYRLNRNDLQLDSIRASSFKNSTLNRKLESAGKLRRQQANVVHSEVKSSPYPVLVVGDFNAPPTSYVYWRIKLGLRDCFLETGRAQLGNTYIRHHLGIRIDYILCSRSMQPLDFHIDKVHYSDHYPIMATVGW